MWESFDWFCRCSLKNNFDKAISIGTEPLMVRFPLAQKIEVLDSEETLKYKNISIWI